MKNLLFILLAIPLISYGQTQATLLYNWHDSTILSYNEVWGVVANDKEFAVIWALYQALTFLIYQTCPTHKNYPMRMLFPVQEMSSVQPSSLIHRKQYGTIRDQ